MKRGRQWRISDISAGTSGALSYSKPGLAKPSGDSSTSLSTRAGCVAAKVQAIRPPIELPISVARATPRRSISAATICMLRASV